jgi:aldehyde dehydrogenase (NAD+)
MNSVTQILGSMSYGTHVESDSAAKTWIATHAGEFQLFIDGTWRAVVGGARAEIRVQPGDAILASIAVAGAAEIALAVDAAAAAGPAWAARSGRERAAVLSELARLLQQSSGLLAVLDSLASGTPIRRARLGDVAAAIREIGLQAGSARLSPHRVRDHEPLGVVAAIQSRQDPLSSLARQSGAALAAGNTLVLKPAQSMSLSALYFGELCLRAGVPPGVVNVVTGPAATGDALAAHDRIAKLCFAGQPETGRQLAALAARPGGRFHVEVDGAIPFLVFDDADLDAAVEAFVETALGDRSRHPTAGPRLMIEEGVDATLIAKIRARLATIRSGPPLDPGVDVGERDPTWREFIDARLAASSTFCSTRESIALARGLRDVCAVSVWSENLNRALDAAHAVNAPVVAVNSTHPQPAETQGQTRQRRATSRRKASAIPAASATPPNWAANTSMTAALRRRGSATAAAAVDLAWGGEDWAKAGALRRAQVLEEIADHWSRRSVDIARRLRQETGASAAAAAREVAASIERLLAYAAWARQDAGQVQSDAPSVLALRVREPLGVVAVVCPDALPLLGFVSLVAPVLAVGNRCVALPSQAYPGLAADLDELVDVAGLPGAALRLVIGAHDALASSLAAHDRLDALWCHGSAVKAGELGRIAARNGTRAWIEDGNARDWWRAESSEGLEFMEAASRVKTIYIPYGD